MLPKHLPCAVAGEEFTKEEYTAFRAEEVPWTSTVEPGMKKKDETEVEEPSYTSEKSKKLKVDGVTVVELVENEENVMGDVEELKEETDGAVQPENAEVNEEVHIEPSIMEEDTVRGMVRDDEIPQGGKHQGDDVMDEYGEQEGEKETWTEETAEGNPSEPAREETGKEEIAERNLAESAREKAGKKEIAEGNLTYCTGEETWQEEMLWQICGKRCATAPSEDNDTILG